MHGNWTLASLPTVMIALMLAGCHSAPPPATQPIAPPADAATAQSLLKQYQAQDPTALVGLVIAVLPDANLAAIGGVPVEKFKAGDYVTFIDSTQATIAVGTVVSVLPDAVHVKFSPSGERARAPREGDLAVHLQS